MSRIGYQFLNEKQALRTAKAMIGIALVDRRSETLTPIVVEIYDRALSYAASKNADIGSFPSDLAEAVTSGTLQDTYEQLIGETQ